MSFLGVLVNTLTVLVGGTVGLLCKKGLPEKLTDAVMRGIGLVTVYIGITGALKGENTLVLIVSVVLGAVLGTLLDIDRAITRLGDAVARRFRGGAAGSADATAGTGTTSAANGANAAASAHAGGAAVSPLASGGARAGIADGFVTASLLFCVGSMTIVGSLNAGLNGDNRMLYTKSLLDLVSSCMLAASLGAGVLCASAFVLVFQGALVLLSGALQGVLTTAASNELICVGSVLIIGLGLNLLGVTKLKVANYLPALLFAPLLVWLLQLPFVQQLLALL